MSVQSVPKRESAHTEYRSEVEEVYFSYFYGTSNKYKELGVTGKVGRATERAHPASQSKEGYSSPESLSSKCLRQKGRKEED